MAVILCQQNRLDEAENTFLKAAANPLYESPEIAITNAGSLSLQLRYRQRG